MWMLYKRNYINQIGQGKIIVVKEGKTIVKEGKTIVKEELVKEGKTIVKEGLENNIYVVV